MTRIIKETIEPWQYYAATDMVIIMENISTIFTVVYKTCFMPSLHTGLTYKIVKVEDL